MITSFRGDGSVEVMATHSQANLMARREGFWSPRSDCVSATIRCFIGKDFVFRESWRTVQ